MGDNALAALIVFVEGLQAANISYSLGCSRDAIMVTIPFPDRYVEAEFFSDGHTEVQSFGPPASDVQEFSPGELLEAVIEHMNAESGLTVLGSKFG